MLKDIYTLIQFTGFLDEFIPNLKEIMIAHDPALEDAMNSLEALDIAEINIPQIVKAANSVISIEAAGATLLILCAKYGRLKYAQFLMKHVTVDVNAQDKNGRTALHHAAEHGRVPIIEMLKSFDSLKVNIQDKEGCTALLLAAYFGKAYAIDALLSIQSIDANLVTVYGGTPLLKAVCQRKVLAVKYLLNCSSLQPNIQNKAGQTPLLSATQQGDEQLIELLLGNEKIVMTEKELECAASHLNKSIFIAFFQSDKFIPNQAIFLDPSIISSRREILEMFIRDPRSDINVKNTRGDSILTILSRDGKFDLLRELLVDSRLDVNMKDSQGRTEFQCALAHNNYRSVECLVKCPRIEHQFTLSGGITPLMALIDREALTDHPRTATNIIKSLLLLPNIDLCAKNDMGKTVLDLAKEAKKQIADGEWCSEHFADGEWRELHDTYEKLITIDDIISLLIEGHIKQFYEKARKSTHGKLQQLLAEHREAGITQDLVCAHLFKVIDAESDPSVQISTLEQAVDLTATCCALSVYLHGKSWTVATFIPTQKSTAAVMIQERINDLKARFKNISVNGFAASI